MLSQLLDQRTKGGGKVRIVIADGQCHNGRAVGAMKLPECQ